MSDELFEVAFAGKILADAELDQVKKKVAAIFKADDAKLAHLFSGKRVVIKKNIDQATAQKYKSALNNAGAECEIKSLSAAVPENNTVNEKVASATAPVASSSIQSTVGSGSDSQAPEAPQTAPLGINAGDIEDLSAGIAPVGSDMQNEIREVPEPELDISGIDMAPAGSDLGQEKQDEAPPPPDTTGLSLLD